MVKALVSILIMLTLIGCSSAAGQNNTESKIPQNSIVEISLSIKNLTAKKDDATIVLPYDGVYPEHEPYGARHWSYAGTCCVVIQS